MSAGEKIEKRESENEDPSPKIAPVEESAVSQSDGQTPVLRRFFKHWLYATILLCCYGFFKEFKPSEPFLTPYLTSEEFKNFSKSKVSSEVYPYWTYSYLVAAFFTFLLTDFVRYKPVILLECCAYLTTRILLIWGTSIAAMQWMQVAYGIATATEIAYFSYIYAAVSIVHFKKVTSYVRAIRLFGQSIGGIVGQILISTQAVNYLTLNYFSLVSVSIACVIAIFLPEVWECDCCQGRSRSSREVIERKSAGRAIKQWFITEIMSRARDFVKFYSRLSLLKWSIWWALAMCGVLQVGNYVQVLWKEVAGQTNHEWNGIVEAVATLCSAAAAFVLSFMKVNWALWGELTIGGLSLLDSIILLLASSASQLWGVYLSHIVYRTTFSFLITIASAQLAQSVDHKSYAMIFGFNTFLALVLQSLLTLVVSDDKGLHLPIRTQFVVYSGYYYVLTLVFVGAGVYKLTSEGWFNSFKRCFQEMSPTQPSPVNEQRPGHVQVSESDENEALLDKLV